MKKIKGIIFDMDGTILNTIEDIADSINYALDYYGYPIHNLDKITLALGNGGWNLVSQLVPQGLEKIEIDNVFKTYQAYYDQHNKVKTRPYDGIMELLETLKKKKYVLAVVSNKFQHLVSDLNQEMFKGIFDYAMGERTGIPIKPQPDMIFHVLSELKLNPDEVLFVGDSEVDVETAIRAKLTCIGVTWGFRSRDVLINAGANYLIDYPNDLITLLERNNL